MKNLKTYIAIAVILAAAVLIVAVGLAVKKKKTDYSSQAGYTVRQGQLTISYVETGTLKARQQNIIKSQVEGVTTIVFIVDEGTRVKQGDLLVELDTSDLQDRKIDQEITVQNKDASYVSAKENLAIVENQAKSDVDMATLNLEFAKQDLDKYINGEYPYELDKAEAEIALAQEELIRAKQTLKDSEKLSEEKYISKTELQADQIAAKKKDLDAQLAKKSKALLTEYTYKRTLAELKSDVSQSEMELERTQRKANANIIQAKAELQAKESELNRQKNKLEKLKDQIEKAKIYAPSDGLVIYTTSTQKNRWSSQEPYKVGSTVREREEIIYLPVGDQCKAEIGIHESKLKKITKGMPVIITVDALSNKKFDGQIETIAPLPDAQRMFLTPDLKVYNCDVTIDANEPALKTGMSCQAEIIVEKLENAVYVPLQAVTAIGNQPVVYVKTANGFEPRDVELGNDDNKVVHIKSGLAKGEIVLLTPPLKQTDRKI